MAHPRGESGSDAVRLYFDRRLMLQFRGSLVTSDAGLLAYRELDDVLGLTEMAGDVLADARSGKNGRHALAGLFRHWSPCRIRGCERRRAPAPRSGYALDCRRQSGAEERGFAESDGALRDAMARGAQELRCSCPPVWPVDRPCARPKATPWHRARHGFKSELLDRSSRWRLPDPRCRPKRRRHRIQNRAAPISAELAKTCRATGDQGIPHATSG